MPMCRVCGKPEDDHDQSPAEVERPAGSVWIHLKELHTILMDSAAQTNRAAPVVGNADDWREPGEKWWESFTDCVDRQVRCADEKRD